MKRTSKDYPFLIMAAVIAVAVVTAIVIGAAGLLLPNQDHTLPAECRLRVDGKSYPAVAIVRTRSLDDGMPDPAKLLAYQAMIDGHEITVTDKNAHIYSCHVIDKGWNGRIQSNALERMHNV